MDLKFSILSHPIDEYLTYSIQHLTKRYASHKLNIDTSMIYRISPNPIRAPYTLNDSTGMND